MKYTIYTDGAYSKQHDEGAFAYVILNGENAEIERNAYKITKETNNRAELKAIIAAVNRLPDDATDVCVFSDSQYALNTLSGKWKHSSNLDLFVVWDKVLEKKQVNIEYNWVRGHDGNTYNELCDKLCNAVLGYDANAEFEKYKKTGKKEKQTISLEFAWALYNFINNWKAGNYGAIPLEDALNKDFDY